MRSTTDDSRFQTSQVARELLDGLRHDSYLCSLLFGLGQAFEVRLPVFVFAAEDTKTASSVEVVQGDVAR
jgi:hypothetical protein